MRKRHKKSTKLPLILLYTIIPFLAFFLYISFSLQISPFSVVKLFLNVPPKVNYHSFSISFQKDIPESLQEMIVASVDDIQMGDIKRFEFKNRGKYTIEYDSNLDDPLFSKQYVFVGHMYWIKGDITLEQVKQSGKIYIPNTNFELDSLLLESVLGNEVEIEGSDDLLSQLKGNENYIGVVSLDDLDGKFKVLNLDKGYFLDDGKGALDIGFTVKGEGERDFVQNIIRRNMEIMYGANRVVKAKEILKINMGGVVAITRGLASKMDSVKDNAYAAKYIGQFLADADLTHVSNEVSFVPGCTSYSGMRFCSRPEYIETLKASGVNIVELTGNHNNDFGAVRSKESIEMYKELGWDYFGGGLNSEDASKALYKEQKGSRVAFLGYNYYDSMFNSIALAGENRSGANFWSVAKMTSDIAKAKENADIVIVTFQFQECWSYPPTDVIYPICYKPLRNPDQKGVFRKAIDLGADIVVGTQAHQPQTFEAYNSGLIFYGLGNLYFDQIKWIGTRQGLILSLYIFEGQLLQAKLTPILLGMDRIPKLASESDSNLLLNLLKSARDF